MIPYHINSEKDGHLMTMEAMCYKRRFIDDQTLLAPMSQTVSLQHALNHHFPKLCPHTTFKLSTLFSIEHYPRNTPVLRQGQHWNKVLIIESGLLRMHFLRKDGREFNKNFFTESTLLCPLTPVMQHQASLFGISCIEPSTLWSCDIQTFVLALPEGCWETLRSQLLTQLLDSKLQREHDLLALTSKQRYEKFLQTKPQLAQRVPLSQLATYLGVTDVSLSRLRRQLKQS